METILDLSGVLEWALSFIVMLIGGAASWALKMLADFLRTKTGIELDDSTRKYLNDAIDKGIQYGASKVEQLLEDKAEIDVKNQIVAIAGKYVLDAVPGALEKFEITEERLTNMIEARIGVDLDGDGDIGQPGVLQAA